MAGAGFKTFVDGDILTAAEVNTYLMEQSVMVFADAAARTSGIAAPSEGMITYLVDTNAVEKYTGASWVNVNDNTDAILKTIVDAKGDLIAGTAADTVSRLAVGTNGYVLTADSAEATGLKWAALPGASGALTKIATASPSAVSSVTFDSVFTSTYRNYFMTMELVGSSAEIVRCVFRTGGVDNTNSNYSFQQFSISNTTFSNSLSQNQAHANISIVGSSDKSFTSCYLANPQASTETQIQANVTGLYTANTPTVSAWYGHFNDTTSFDGIKIYPLSGTITGTIKIYGLED